MRQGDIFFVRDLIKNPNQLPELFRARLRRGCERKVYIRGDARTRYRAVAKVLDAVRAAGLENVAFLVEQRRSLSN